MSFKQRLNLVIDDDWPARIPYSSGFRDRNIGWLILALGDKQLTL